jgi:hypothetical protein
MNGVPRPLIHWNVYRLRPGGYLGMVDGTDAVAKTMFPLVWAGAASGYDTAILAAIDKECGL